jgi:hypothetical protein
LSSLDVFAVSSLARHGELKEGQIVLMTPCPFGDTAGTKSGCRPVLYQEGIRGFYIYVYVSVLSSLDVFAVSSLARHGELKEGQIILMTPCPFGDTAGTR